MSGPVVALTTGSPPDAFALKAWFDEVAELRGRSTVEVGPTRSGDLGGVSDVLVVALGSGGAVSVVAASLMRWLSARRRSYPLKLTVIKGKNKVSIEVDQTAGSAELITDILRAIDDHGP
jgi:Effector Associated Constant Component 1